MKMKLKMKIIKKKFVPVDVMVGLLKCYFLMFNINCIITSITVC